MKYVAFAAAAIVLAAGLGGCSTVMEYHRPDPVDLKQFSVGEKRFDVVKEIGEPVATEKNDGHDCDMYKLVTHGVSRAEKGAIIFGEAAADIYTLGLFEVVATPAEAMSKNKIHNVVFCYSPEKLLLSITESGMAGAVVAKDTPNQSAVKAASGDSPAPAGVTSTPTKTP